MPSHPAPSGERSALLIDPSVVGQSHLLVNTGIARLAVSRHERVTLIAEATHCDALKQYLGPDISAQITFVPWRRRSEIRKTIRQVIAGRQFDQIIFTNVEYLLFAYMVIFHWRASRKPILWMLHSHFVNAVGPKKAWRIKTLMKWYLLFRTSERVKFVVLGSRIRANIEAMIGSLARPGSIISIIHPVGIAPLTEDRRSAAVSASRTPRVLFIPGWHALLPGNQELLSNLERIAPEARRFEVVVLANKFEGANNKKTFLMEYTDRLNQIAQAEFFLHLPSDPYRLQASGAMMDMLLTGTPMIGLRTDFGEELTGIIGDFGYFFDDREGLLHFLRSAELDLAEVHRFQANLAAGYEKIVALSQAQFDAVIAS